MGKDKDNGDIQPVQASRVKNGLVDLSSKPLPLSPLAGVNKFEKVELTSVLFTEAVQCGGSGTTSASWNGALSVVRDAKLFYTPEFGGCVKIENAGQHVYIPISKVRQFTPATP